MQFLDTVLLVFLGSASDRIEGLVRDAVTQAGGSLATVVAVREPLDLPGLAREASGTRYATLGAETSKAGLQLVVALLRLLLKKKLLSM